MVSKIVKIGAARPRARTFYERFMAKEGVPVIEGYGVSDVREIAMSAWSRLGCDGAYLQFYGSDGSTGIHAGKIAPGATTLPERHLYEEIVYILAGEGTAEIQQRDRVPQTISWQAGSLFAPPMNTLHRLINHSDKPALFLAITTAPLALDHYHNEQFVFNCDFAFNDRYDGEDDYFAPSNGRYVAMGKRQWTHQTNFIPDLRQCRSETEGEKNNGVKLTQFEISNNSLIGYLAEWPVGRYRKAHCRSGGVALVILRSTGYSLMWPSYLGTEPYKNGVPEKVIRVDWAPGSVFSPPANWYHQHFNTGHEPAQTLAVYCGSDKFPVGNRAGALTVENRAPSAANGDGDDPAIQRIYEIELERKGVARDKNFSAAANDD